jgi:7-cyano-7-deazaguanine synthase
MVLSNYPKADNEAISEVFKHILRLTSERGRDSFGITVSNGVGKLLTVKLQKEDMIEYSYNIFEEKGLKPEKPWMAAIANFRGEPTTEYISIKSPMSIQPFGFGEVSVVHNGTIPNDVEILENGIVSKKLKERGYVEDIHGKIIDSYALLEEYYKLKEGVDDNEPIPNDRLISHLTDNIEGSYSYALLTNDFLMIGRNWRGLAAKVMTVKSFPVLFFASKPEYLAPCRRNNIDTINSAPINSSLIINAGMREEKLEWSIASLETDKALVVCSGGLDSTTVATMACKKHEEVTLLHFLYGCKAEPREVQAIHNIADTLTKQFPNTDIDVEFIDINWLADIGGSTLTDKEYGEIAEGDTGVETCNEWVPARNLIMLSLAAGYCDRWEISNIYLGNNMEEGSSYRDNTNTFVDITSRAVEMGTISETTIKQPISNLMKHEIVKLAYDISAPIEYSWSCYHDEEEECWRKLKDGEDPQTMCGPCYMKYMAFKINKLTVSDFIDKRRAFK